mmetsp:Transcript_9560/g.24460  ORF Transcript_9560/g.24460 Transcript_9560/m.24460 type:complete len:337 (+) Transcript_9560:488-1498(+)
MNITIKKNDDGLSSILACAVERPQRFLSLDAPVAGSPLEPEDGLLHAPVVPPIQHVVGVARLTPGFLPVLKDVAEEELASRDHGVPASDLLPVVGRPAQPQNRLLDVLHARHLGQLHPAPAVKGFPEDGLAALGAQPGAPLPQLDEIKGHGVLPVLAEAREGPRGRRRGVLPARGAHGLVLLPHQGVVFLAGDRLASGAAPAERFGVGAAEAALSADDGDHERRVRVTPVRPATHQPRQLAQLSQPHLGQGHPAARVDLWRHAREKPSEEARIRPQRAEAKAPHQLLGQRELDSFHPLQRRVQEARPPRAADVRHGQDAVKGPLPPSPPTPGLRLP